MAPPLSLHAWLRFDAINRLLPADARSLLEIGAGLGSAGALLTRRYDYVGLEPDAESFAIAIGRIGAAGSMLNLGSEDYASPAEGFDAVCAFEVLEHLEDDRAAVWEWSRHARAGGWLLVSVPAGAGRFGRADAEAGHYRRYDRAGLVDVLDSAGLDKVEVITYGFPLGYALEAFRNAYSRRTARAHTLEERTAASGRWLQPPESAALITRVASLPFRYAQRPFSHTHWGTGLVARARRPR